MIAILAMAAAAALPDPVEGTWEGSSLCQVHPSPCLDEHALYHATRIAPGRYRFVMNKVVGGEEQSMGTTEFRFDARRAVLIGTTQDRQGRTAHWTFRLKGSRRHLSGRLINPDGRLYRLIEVDKQ